MCTNGYNSHSISNASIEMKMDQYTYPMYPRLDLINRSQIDSIGLPRLSVPIAFYTLWQHARVLIYSTGSATLDASILFCMPWQHCFSKPGYRLIHWIVHIERF